MKAIFQPRVFVAAFIAIAIAMQGSLQATQAAPQDESAQALAYLFKNDAVLSRTFGQCPGLSFKRTQTSASTTFLIDGSCDIKNSPEENADCPAYRIHATGTVDTPSHWTIRQLQLTLMCSEEGMGTHTKM
ncbi:hypothetical protein [Xanthomonas maliensis]|uniref:hypothetical protein n=1 Tax=Xanthomonas maliensis TaxID=1321368 RepID=UPI001264908B|nr:hypothetical protein [Xanthomonas maliensis]KAB7766372.1 hypothetical protein CKY51_14160 [Xanthomonas maliensis]